MAGIHHVIPRPARRFVIGSKIMGATLWCWVFWRLKHDPEEVFVSNKVGTGIYILFIILLQGHWPTLEPPPLNQTKEN